MADESTGQFAQAWWAWRNALPKDQQWMADAMAWSATHGDVQGYEANGWSWQQLNGWLQEQNRQEWQAWSQSWDQNWEQG